MCQPTGVVGALRNHATFSPNEKLSKALPRALFLCLDKDFYALEMQKTQEVRAKGVFSVLLSR
jgi:hypothetical protein